MFLCFRWFRLHSHVVGGGQEPVNIYSYSHFTFAQRRYSRLYFGLRSAHAYDTDS